MAPRRVVFTGGPGAGKTAVLQALRLQGHTVANDTARAIIRDRRRRSLEARPSPLEFAQAILLADIAQYGVQASSGLVFFERGVVDALGMLHELGAMRPHELQERLSAYAYHRRVFVFPPWEAIYATDDERDHTFAEAAGVYQRSLDWYRHCGYETIEVPEATVAQRCAFVLESLSSTACTER